MATNETKPPTRAQRNALGLIRIRCADRPGEWFHVTEIFPARGNVANGRRRAANRACERHAEAAAALGIECDPLTHRFRLAPDPEF